MISKMPAKGESLPGEEWRSIPGHNPQYQVSSLGRIRKIAIGKKGIKYCIMKTHKAKHSGTVCVAVNNPREGIKRSLLGVGTCMAKAFFGERYNSRNLIHKDGNKDNFEYSNLSIVSETLARSSMYGENKYIRKVRQKRRGRGKRRRERYIVSCIREKKRYWFGAHSTMEAATKARDKWIPQLDWRIANEITPRDPRMDVIRRKEK